MEVVLLAVADEHEGENEMPDSYNSRGQYGHMVITNGDSSHHSE